MANILLILFLLIFFVLLFLLFFPKQIIRLAKKIKTSPTFVPSLKEKEFNPDTSTDNWNLHRLRLYKFRRSQYKGLTFFVSSENRIYYLSEEGNIVYC